MRLIGRVTTLMTATAVVLTGLPGAAHAADPVPVSLRPAGVTDISAGQSVGYLNSRVSDQAGDLLVVGVQAVDGPFQPRGGAYVFRRQNDRWALEALLQAPTPVLSGSFGQAVTTNGTEIAVSAARQAEGGSDPAVFVFRKTGVAWRTVQTLTGGTGASTAYGGTLDFDGPSLALLDSAGVLPNGYRGVVEVWDPDATGTYQRRFQAPGRETAGFTYAGGTLFLGRFAFTVTSTGLDYQATFFPGYAQNGSGYFGGESFYNLPDRFLVDGNRMAIVEVYGRVDGVFRGRVTVFERQSDSTWRYAASIVSPHEGFDDMWGFNAALRGDDLLVGAPGSADAVYHYVAEAGGWSEAPKLVSPRGLTRQGFGMTVALDGGIVGVIAGQFNGGMGALWSLRFSTGEQTGIVSDASGAVESLGRFVAVDGDLVASTTRRSEARVEQGVVRVFTRTATGLVQTAVIDPPSDGRQVTSLGPVALDGDTLAVATSDESGCPGGGAACYPPIRVLIYKLRQGQWQYVADVHTTYGLGGGEIDVEDGELAVSGRFANTGGTQLFREQPDGSWSADGGGGSYSGDSTGYETDLSSDGTYLVQRVSDTAAQVAQRRSDAWIPIGQVQVARFDPLPALLPGGRLAVVRAIDTASNVSVVGFENGSAVELASVSLPDRRALTVRSFDDGVVVSSTDQRSLDPRLDVLQLQSGGLTVTSTARPQNGQNYDSFGSSLAASPDLVVVGAQARSGAAGWYTGALELFTLTRDDVAPVVTPVPARPANANGWYAAPVDVSWDVQDPAPSSGLASTPRAVTADVEGRAVRYTSGPACDRAGNCATGTVLVNLDQTAPTVGTPALSVNPKARTQTTALSASASDALSGVTSGEYFLGDDPGRGNGTAMTLSGGQLTTTIGTGLDAGVYALGVRAVDAAGNWSSVSSTYLVVYDPEGGFVTGGGQIDSPAGALRDSGATGKATFGFVSKYRPGATVPTGNTEFSFTAGGFSFKSTSYDWLVVAGQKAQYKGTGTVNGKGSYTFLLTATDGGTSDSFRLKVSDSTGVVYDNKRGEADTPGVGSPVTSGSVIVHRS